MISWTDSQQHARSEFNRFLSDSRPCCIMILKGAAGTGKSTLIGEFLRMAESAGNQVALLAPTGRAARVLGDRANHMAGTIHGCIYNLQELSEQKGETEQPVLRFQLKKSQEAVNTVFIVDEASMVGNKETVDENLRFGSGKLLQDLLQYVFHDHPDSRRKLVFVGDHCQLPPVGDPCSQALSKESLARLTDANVYELELTDILRQLEGSALIQQAHSLRAAIDVKRFDRLAWTSGQDLVQHTSSGSFFSAYCKAIEHLRFPHLVCYRNATVCDWNKRIREDALKRGDQIEPGDLLVVQRNHFQSGLQNGDFVRVLELGKRIQRPFKDTTLVYREAVIGEERTGQVKHEGLIIENQLLSPERGLSSEEEQARWVQFKLDYADLFRKKPASAENQIVPGARGNQQTESRLPVSIKEALLTDRFWNALQVRYGYATTCHKAQGGEWEDVFVHCDWGSRGGQKSEGFFRWLYTAVTRARVRLHLLEVPSFQPWDGLLPTSNERSDEARVAQSTVSTAKPQGFPEQLKEIICQLLQAQNARLVEWDSKPYMFRVRAEQGELLLQFDLHYSGKEELRNIGWSAGSPLFQLPELQARLLKARNHPFDREELPPGVIEAIDVLERAAEQESIELYWEAKPFQMLLKALDPAQLELGLAEASFHYKKNGQSHSLQMRPADVSLKSRLRRIFEQLGIPS